MRVLITGATGFLGHAIARELLLRGHELVVVSRNIERARASFPYPASFVAWEPVDASFPAEALSGVDVVVHLAGEPVAARRWSPEQKKKIRDSRVLGTRHLWQGIAQARALGKTGTLKAFVAGSAIGIYGDRGDEALTEASPPGEGFLADVCRQWESEVFRPGFDEVRQVAIRTGVVLGRESGALAKLMPLFRAGAGGPVGSGKQWLSWIHLEDIARVFAEAVENETFRGAINGVAPGPVTNAMFGQALARVLERPATVPAPAAVLKLALGEMAHVVLDSQRVRPEKLSRESFVFRYPGTGFGSRGIFLRSRGGCGSRSVRGRTVGAPRPIEEMSFRFSRTRKISRRSRRLGSNSRLKRFLTPPSARAP